MIAEGWKDIDKKGKGGGGIGSLDENKVWNYAWDGRDHIEITKTEQKNGGGAGIWSEWLGCLRDNEPVNKDSIMSL